MLATHIHAELPKARLTTLTPTGGQAGTTVDVTIAGSDIEAASRIVFSHKGIKSAQKTTGEGDKATPVANQFVVTIAKDVPVGFYEARIVGRYGMTNPRVFVVGNRKEILETGEHASAATAQLVSLGSVINGRIDAEKGDFFKFSGKKDQRVLVECLAHDIDSRLQASIVVFDSAGREFSRSRRSRSRDPLLDVRLPADGEYTVLIHDFLYAGGAEHFYRLAIHAGPHIDFIFPPAGVPGSRATYTVYGRNLPSGKPTTDVKIGGVAIESMELTVELPVGNTSPNDRSIAQSVAPYSTTIDGKLVSVGSGSERSNSAYIGFASAPVVTESQPNDSPTQAQVVDVPCEYVGQFYPRYDQDWIQFKAQKGQVFWIDLMSHRLGLETDPKLIVQKVVVDDSGKETVSQIASIDDASRPTLREFDLRTDDPQYRFVANADATYRVGVQDLHGGSRGDPRFVYRLAIRQPKPDYRLIAYPRSAVGGNKLDVMPAVIRRGGAMVMNVAIERRDGFDGEIVLHTEGLPAGVSCKPVTVSPKSSSASLVIEAAIDSVAWNGPLRVVGWATIDGVSTARYARGGSLVWGSGNITQQAGVARMTGDIGLAVIDNDPAVAAINVGNGQVIETSRGAKLTLPISVTRRDEFSAALKLVVEGLPKELKPKDVEIKETDGKLELALTDAKVAAGTYQFFLTSTAKAKYVRNRQAVKQAETRQKQLDARIKKLSDELTAATSEQDKLTKAAVDAEATVSKQVTNLSSAKEKQQSAGEVTKLEEELAKAKAALQQAAEKKVVAEKKIKETEAQLKEAQDQKPVVDKQVADVKKANPPKDTDVYVVSSPVRLVVHDSPLSLTVQQRGLAVRRGGKVAIPVLVNRKFGCDEAIEITLERSGGNTGLTIEKLVMPKGQSTALLIVAVNSKAPLGDSTATITAKAKFNGLDVATKQNLVFQILDQIGH